MTSVLPQRLALGTLWLYKRIVSPWLPPSCRFTPSCSEYAAAAIKRYGAFEGSARAVRRLLRCQPFSRGGFDPLT